MGQTKIKEYSAKRLDKTFTQWEAPGFLALCDECGVAVRKFRRDNETGRWLVFNSLEQWIGQLDTRGDVNEAVENYVREKTNEK